MAESEDGNGDHSMPKAVKDKSCEYCGQAFTSSSLGRHLDQYIKEKNPKPPDGIHDVEAIRRLRSNITRRQPRGSLARRQSSTPAGTPAAKQTPASEIGSPTTAVSAPIPQQKEKSLAEVTTNFGPFLPRWEATGVINNIPESPADATFEQEMGIGSAPETTQEPVARRPLPNAARVMSRQVTKAQLTARQQYQDALDTSRAAELAFREFLASYRAAK